MEDLIVVLLLFILFLAVLIIYYVKKRCKPIINLNTSCPNVLNTQYPESPVGICLSNCDKLSDICYNKCNPNDEQCISNCYQIKAKCYMDCLNSYENLQIYNNQGSNNNTCGCA